MPFSKIFCDFLSQNTQQYSQPNINLEQYATPIYIVEKLFSPDININGKRVLDLGSGLGTLSFTAAWLGAIEVIGIDCDISVLIKAQSLEKTFTTLLLSNSADVNKDRVYFLGNNKVLNYDSYIPIFTWINSNIEYFYFKKFQNKIDLIVMNPPFGTQRPGIDFVFIEQAIGLQCPILSIHKDAPKFIPKLTHLFKNAGYEVDIGNIISYSLSKSMPQHRLKTYNVPVRIVKAWPL